MLTMNKVYTHLRQTAVDAVEPTPCSDASATPVLELDEYGVPLKLGSDPTYLAIKEVLEEMLPTPEAVKTWLHTSRLGGSTTPLEYILEGKLDAARRMVGSLEYGIPS
jgi:hypothetical protein